MSEEIILVEIVDADIQTIEVTDAADIEILEVGTQGPPGGPGVGIPSRQVLASEALAAGDTINLWNNAGVQSVRLASAAAKGTPAHGFVTAAVAGGQLATVFFGGVNAAAVGLTPGDQWLSVTPGKTVALAPSGPGQVVQKVGYAFTATEFMFQAHPAITRST